MKNCRNILLITVFLLATVLVGCIFGDVTTGVASATGEFSSGMGTAVNPYLLSSSADLENLSELVRDGAVDNTNNGGAAYSSLCYKLTSNINMNNRLLGFTAENEPYLSSGDVSSLSVFTPLGTSTKPFTGTFDGDGHTISGLYATGTLGGLFGCISGSTVTNLSVSASYFSVSGAAGGIVGSAASSAISACSTAATVYVGSSGSAGGVVGVSDSSSVDNCTTSARVNSTSTTGGAGGVVGEATASSVLNSCNGGRVFSAVNGGGIIGLMTGGSVKNCLNTANVTGTVKGGIAGAVSGTAMLDNNYFVKTTGVNSASSLVGSTVSTATAAANGKVTSNTSAIAALETSELNNSTLEGAFFGASTTILCALNAFAADNKEAGCTGWKTDTSASPAFGGYPFVTVDEVYSLSLVANGGTFADGYSIPSAFVKNGNAVTLPQAAELSRGGYTFVGWFASSDGGSTLTGSAVTTVSGGSSNLTYYAKWTFDAPSIAAISNVEVIYSGTAAEVTAVPSHGLTTAVFSYEWQKKAAGTSEWRAFELTGAALSYKNVADSGSYRVRAKAADGALVSSASDWVVFSVTVTKAPLQVVADSAVYTYGETHVFGYILQGLRGTDTAATVFSVLPSYAVSKTGAGTYDSEILFSGAVAVNYSVTYAAATLKINPVNLVVTADAKTAVEGAVEQRLTYAYEGTFVGSDGFSGSLSRAAGSTPGRYEILQGTLTAGNNYKISFIGAVYTIRARTLSYVGSTIAGSVQQVGGFESGVNFEITKLTENPALLVAALPDEATVAGSFSFAFFKDGAEYLPSSSSNKLYVTLSMTLSSSVAAYSLANSEVTALEVGSGNGKVTFVVTSPCSVILAELPSKAAVSDEPEGETKVTRLVWAYSLLAVVVVAETVLLALMLVYLKKRRGQKLFSFALSPMIAAAVMLGEVVLTAVFGGLALVLGALCIFVALRIRADKKPRAAEEAADGTIETSAEPQSSDDSAENATEPQADETPTDNAEPQVGESPSPTDGTDENDGDVSSN